MSAGIFGRLLVLCFLLIINMSNVVRQDVKKEYLWIMDKVIKSVQPEFAQHGVDENVLKYLCDLWEQKLVEKGVMEDLPEAPPGAADGTRAGVKKAKAAKPVARRAAATNQDEEEEVLTPNDAGALGTPSLV